MHTDLLIQAGLSEKEAAVYEKLLELGPSSVGRLIKLTPFKRGDLYNILYSLRDKGLLSEELKKGVMTFTLENPEKLQDLVALEKEKLEHREKLLSDAFPQLKSLYNLSMKRPGVRFFEGDKGVLDVLHDSLRSKTEIYSIGDIDSILKFHPTISKEYSRKRGRLSIVKRGIAIDTPTARQYLADHYKNITTTKLIALPQKKLFETLMHIYDGRVSYITLPENVGVIVEDGLIYEMHKMLFEFIWEAAPGTVV